MRHTAAIAGRELRSLFSTPVAYVVLSAYIMMAGFFFLMALGGFLQDLERIQAYQALQYLDQLNLNGRVIGPVFVNCSILLVFLVPLVTMRLFAEERANGTFELLLTSPLTAWEIVLGKYLAAATIVSLLVLISAAFPALLFLYSAPDAPSPEVLLTLAGLIGLLLYGLMLAALGCLTSSLTRSQAIAAAVAIFAGLFLFLLDYAAQVLAQDTVSSVLREISIGPHFEFSLQGMIRTRDLAYFGLSVVFLLAVVRLVVESMRWR